MTKLSIYAGAGLTPEEIATTDMIIEGTSDADFFSTPAYEKLYEHLAFDLVEMPYGIAKCRTGEPDVWIIDYLSDICVQ